MFSTFTKADGGALIIRTQDIREIADVEDRCLLSYWLGNRMATVHIEGGAEENLDRLKQIEMAAYLAAQQAQVRQQNGLPPVPIKRGKA